MNSPVKFNAVNYPLSSVFLIIITIYLYFISPFTNNLFFLIFFTILSILSLCHKYALEISDAFITYKPFPLFFTKTIAVTDITNIAQSDQRITIQTLNEETLIIRKYFLKNKQWNQITEKIENIVLNRD